jgi:hypothetical protein
MDSKEIKQCEDVDWADWPTIGFNGRPFFFREKTNLIPEEFYLLGYNAV